jgi:hypothetical protein
VPVSERIGAESQDKRGRPKTPLEIRHLIREMSLANPLWGATRIQGHSGSANRAAIAVAERVL